MVARRTCLTGLRAFPSALLLAVLAWGCGSSGTEPTTDAGPASPSLYEVPEQTGDGWRTASAASVGLSVDALNGLLNQIEGTSGHGIHSVLVARHGTLVLERYWSGEDLAEGTRTPVRRDFDRDTRHYIASVSKSVTSMLTGIALDEGFIRTVDEHLFDYFPDYADLARDDNTQVTLRTLLAFSSGYDWNEFLYGFDDPRDSHNQMFAAADPLQYLLGRTMVATPGSDFLYNSGDTNLMGEIVRRATSSTDLASFAEERLFGPLGITDYAWTVFGQTAQVTFASGGLYMRPRDMAKLGQLYLDRGTWKGVRVVSPSWVDASVALSTRLSSRDHHGYGFNWWLGTSSHGGGVVDFFHALGWGGQDVYVYPDLDLVVVFTAGGYDHQLPLSSLRLIEERILRAVVE